MLVPLSQSALTEAVSVATTASAGSSTESRAVGNNVRVHRISSSGIMHAVLWSVGEPGREIPMSAQENKDLQPFSKWVNLSEQGALSIQ
jgi:hypothetical protein